MNTIILIRTDPIEQHPLRMQKIATPSPPASANLEERRWLPVLQELGALRFGLGSTLVSFSIAGGFAIMTAYSAVPVHAAPGAEPKPATAATQAYLEQFSASLAFADREDFELATRGFVAAIPGNRILDAEGHVLRELNVDGFFSQPAPPTVNPSLWRNAGLVAKSGLFNVSDRVYQVRGVDAANMTIVLGDTGFLVIDSLWIAEAARASIDLAREKLGNRPIMVVVYTHTLVDHYGGIRGF